MNSANAVDACKVKVTLAGVDISGDSTSVTVTPSQASNEITTFGECFIGRTGGLEDFSGSVDGFFNVGLPGVDKLEKTAWDAMKGKVPVPFTYSPNGGGVGEIEYQGDVVVTEAPISAGISDGPQTASFSFDGSGELIRATVA